jgi:hypothetical protein
MRLVQQEGEFRLDASLDDENWINLVSKKVRLDPNALLQPFEQSQPDAPASS